MLIYIAAEGPKTLELAGEIANGVSCGMGISADIANLSLEHIAKCAKRAGRTLVDIDAWGLGRVNIGEHRRDLVNGIRMELASTAHHAFRFTQAGKMLSPRFADPIRKVQQGYNPIHFENLG